MEAGRELDALVAEKVMGWRWYWWRVANTQEPVRALFAPTDDHPTRYDYQPWTPTMAETRVSQSYPMPPYSTDIAAAWQVVEAINVRHDYWLSLEYEGPEATHVEFRQTNGRYFAADSVTSAHAICLGALACVGLLLGNAHQSYPQVDE